MNKPNSVESFVKSLEYRKAIHTESPDKCCGKCSAFFLFEGRTRCYGYEQQVSTDSVIEFNPSEDYTCDFFEGLHSFEGEISAFQDALGRGVDPKKDEKFLKALKKANDEYARSSDFRRGS